MIEHRHVFNNEAQARGFIQGIKFSGKRVRIKLTERLGSYIVSLTQRSCLKEGLYVHDMNDPGEL